MPSPMRRLLSMAASGRVCPIDTDDATIVPTTFASSARRSASPGSRAAPPIAASSAKPAAAPAASPALTSALMPCFALPSSVRPTAVGDHKVGAVVLLAAAAAAASSALSACVTAIWWRSMAADTDTPPETTASCFWFQICKTPAARSWEPRLRGGGGGRGVVGLERLRVSA